MLTGPCLFVTATDTDAGKSFVTAALTRALLAAGHDAQALKPVACGHEPGQLNTDVAALLAAQGMPDADAKQVNRYDFAAYAAPLFAARAESKAVDVAQLSAWCRECCEGHRLTLIEGVGGLMVPLSENALVSDWLQMLPEAYVLLVVRVRLGGINQALLTLDKLQRMGRPPRWVLVNAADSGADAMLADHVAALSPYVSDDTRLLQLPFLPDAGAAQSHLGQSPLFAELEAWLRGGQP